MATFYNTYDFYKDSNKCIDFNDYNTFIDCYDQFTTSDKLVKPFILKYLYNITPSNAFKVSIWYDSLLSVKDDGTGVVDSNDFTRESGSLGAYNPQNIDPYKFIRYEQMQPGSGFTFIEVSKYNNQQITNQDYIDLNLGNDETLRICLPNVETDFVELIIGSDGDVYWNNPDNYVSYCDNSRVTGCYASLLRADNKAASCR